MYIGELASLSGCTAKAIRVYEQMGLLTPQRRGNYRLYKAPHLTLVQMIRTAQAPGFKLGEMSELLAASNIRHGFPWRWPTRALRSSAWSCKRIS